MGKQGYKGNYTGHTFEKVYMDCGVCKSVCKLYEITNEEFRYLNPFYY